MALGLAVIEGTKSIINIEQEIKQTRELFGKLLAFTSDAIVVLNAKKQVIAYSEEFKRFFVGENILGENFFQLTEKITHLPNDFLKENSYFVKINTDGMEKVFEAKIIKEYKNFDEICRYTVIFKDMDNKQEIKEEKDNFIATLTHDLKTPVRANILSLELLLKGHFGELNSEQNEIMDEILNSNKFMMQMLDTLLAKYKYESQMVKLNKTPFNLEQFICECVSDLKRLFQEKNVSYQIITEDANIEVTADRLELKRAILNLLTNAIKFNKDNGVVTVTIKKCKKNIKIVVEDTGIGIEEEKINHIFDKYISYAKRFRCLGTGLGLYVAKKIIEEHGGKIMVSSVVNKGSVFTVVLPL